MLWVADVIAWAHGAGNHWRQIIQPVVDDVCRTALLSEDDAESREREVV